MTNSAAQPLPRASLARFLLRLVLLVLLLVVWPAPGALAVAALRRPLELAAAQVFESRVSVRFCAAGRDRPIGYPDTRVEIFHFRSGVTGNCGLSLHQIAYMPAALLLALVLASPLPGRQRVGRAAAALAAGLVLGALCTVLALSEDLTGTGPLAVWQPTEAARALLDRARIALAHSSLGAYVGPVLLWLVLCPDVPQRFAGGGPTR